MQSMIKLFTKGKIYLNLNFDDDYNDTRKYYNIMNYIENNLKILGHFYEIYIITRVSSDESRITGKIQILIK